MEFIFYFLFLVYILSPLLISYCLARRWGDKKGGVSRYAWSSLLYSFLYLEILLSLYQGAYGWLDGIGRVFSCLIVSFILFFAGDWSGKKGSRIKKRKGVK